MMLLRPRVMLHPNSVHVVMGCWRLGQHLRDDGAEAALELSRDLTEAGVVHIKLRHRHVQGVVGRLLQHVCGRGKLRMDAPHCGCQRFALHRVTGSGSGGLGLET